jgi:hypothetical protein
MVFNATFNNILVISWLSVLLVEETGVPGEKKLSKNDLIVGGVTYINLQRDIYV